MTDLTKKNKKNKETKKANKTKEINIFNNKISFKLLQFF